MDDVVVLLNSLNSVIELPGSAVAEFVITVPDAVPGFTFTTTVTMVPAPASRLKAGGPAPPQSTWVNGGRTGKAVHVVPDAEAETKVTFGSKVSRIRTFS